MFFSETINFGIAPGTMGSSTFVSQSSSHFGVIQIIRNLSGGGVGVGVVGCDSEMKQGEGANQNVTCHFFVHFEPNFTSKVFKKAMFSVK